MMSSEVINASVSDEWVMINFSAVGTTAQSGDIVLAIGGARSPGSWVAGESPIDLRNPAEQLLRDLDQCCCFCRALTLLNSLCDHARQSRSYGVVLRAFAFADLSQRKNPV